MRDPLPIVPDLNGLADTPVGIESAGLARGEAWCTYEIAGLQFYDYHRHDEDLDVMVMPATGDRLQIVRDPENPHDCNAIRIVWRNDRQLGHVPRDLARDVAPILDAGAPGRAYVIDAGDGDAWSCRALIVGAAAAPWHERHLRHVVSEALHARPEGEIRLHRRALKRAERAADRVCTMRTRRLRQAVDVLLTVPFDPDLPDVGRRCTPEALARALACSRSTVVRIASSVGLPIGRYTHDVELTPELDVALRAWCQTPRSKVDPRDTWCARIGRQEPPWDWIA
ncbi:HIRAN domain-containing protein [Methylobacterium sp. 22177]|uniref:HIRAN domain-containing protein n=1 Tax=Methylobacterium sp. 22177 TaxID=3453885 RepID=UPI003F87F79F